MITCSCWIVSRNMVICLGFLLIYESLGMKSFIWFIRYEYDYSMWDNTSNSIDPLDINYEMRQGESEKKTTCQRAYREKITICQRAYTHCWSIELWNLYTQVD